MCIKIDYEEFLDLLYLGILKREPDRAKYYYLEQLNKNKLRPIDLVNFFCSLDELYQRAQPINRKRAAALLLAQDREGIKVGNFDTYSFNQHALIFYHFPKTGGTSLKKRICDYFHPAQIGNISIPQLNLKKFYSDHFTWAAYEKLPPNSKTIACLREPNSRLNSLFFFLKRNAKTLISSIHQDAISVAEESNLDTLDQFFFSKNVRIINVVNNYYVRNLTGLYATDEQDPLQYNEMQAVNLAYERLTSFEMLYLLEELGRNDGKLPDRVTAKLSAYFDTEFDALLPVENKNPFSNEFKIPQLFLTENNKLDSLLYEKIKTEYLIL